MTVYGLAVEWVDDNLSCFCEWYKKHITNAAQYNVWVMLTAGSKSDLNCLERNDAIRQYFGAKDFVPGWNLKLTSENNGNICLFGSIANVFYYMGDRNLFFEARLIIEAGKSPLYSHQVKQWLMMKKYIVKKNQRGTGLLDNGQEVAHFRSNY